MIHHVIAGEALGVHILGGRHELGTIRRVSFDFVLALVHCALGCFDSRLAFLAFGRGYLLRQELLHGLLVLFHGLVGNHLLLSTVDVHLAVVCGVAS